MGPEDNKRSLTEAAGVDEFTVADELPRQPYAPAPRDAGEGHDVTSAAAPPLVNDVSCSAFVVLNTQVKYPQARFMSVFILCK